MTRQTRFGGGHTEQKLKVIQDYLLGYQRVLKGTELSTVYFDAFAGTGKMPGPERPADLLGYEVAELDPFIAGSARRALQIDTPFSKYVLVEKDKDKFGELDRLQVEFPNRIIQCVSGDANDAILQFCRTTNWRNSRAVMFLDPFGSQVDWSTHCTIARCNIDLWYLFPAGLSVNRQISNSGEVDEYHAKSLDRLFGNAGWREEFLVIERKPDLFDPSRQVTTKVCDADTATRYMLRRMKTIFKGGVLDHWLPLGPNNAHWYSLIFAWGNPSPKAAPIAKRIATHLMTRK